MRLAVSYAILTAVASLAGAQTHTSAGLESYHKARQVLDAGVKAAGGLDALRAAKSARRTFEEDWIGSGQGQRPYAAQAPTLTPAPTHQHSRTTSFIDYAGNRWVDESLEYDDFGDSVTRLTVVTSEKGFETVTYHSERPL